MSPSASVPVFVPTVAPTEAFSATVKVDALILGVTSLMLVTLTVTVAVADAEPVSVAFTVRLWDVAVS